MNISWIVGLIIVLLFVVSASFAFYSDEGVFARFKTSYVSFKESAPNVSLGADKLKTDKPSIDELHDSEIDNLKEAIEKMVGSNKNCFQSYAGFTPLDDVSVKFTSEDEVTYVDVFSQGRFVADSSFKFNGSLCVIAGDDVVVKNFATSFLKCSFGFFLVSTYSCTFLWKVFPLSELKNHV